LELVDALKNAAHDSKHEKEAYYRLVFETLRGKLDQTNDQFRNFIFPLLGDKDHEKVLDVVVKVEKNNIRQMQKSSGSGGVLKNRSYPSSRPPRRCFYCLQITKKKNVSTVIGRVILRRIVFRDGKILGN